MRPPAKIPPVLVVAAAFLLYLAGSAAAMRFSHQVHQEQGTEQCSTCHLPDAFLITPDRAVCLECHSEKEIEETVLGPVKTHTPLWVRQHGRDSKDPDAQCSSCHKSSFCADCHYGGEINPDLTRRMFRGDSAPRTHTSRFKVVHPLKAVGEAAETCLACHPRQFCVDCHQDTPPDRLKILSHRESFRRIEAGAGGPLHGSFTLEQCQDCHPQGALSSDEWSRGHASEARKSLSSCQACHPNGDACMACHSARSGLKVSPHPKNWRSIQRKFRGESPETCERCHAAGSY